jgi:predicted 3-demethylubiquinone-9 3-methyltransferase (glyoxalase superfamily)
MSQITSQKIVPFLWFDKEAQIAAEFYTGIFPNSRITATTKYPEGGPMPAETIMSVNFELQGLPFYALNAGPMFKFTPAISFFVNCENQDEVDYFWDKLVLGGREDRCGWLQDQFGLSWQIIPKQLGECLHHKDRAKAQRAMEAMMQMRKIEIEKLVNA